MSDLVVAKIPKVDYSRRWGNSWSQWSEAFEPSVDIQVFSPQSGKANISIETEDGKELQRLSPEASKGVTIFKYDLTLSEKGIKNLEKAGLTVNKGKNAKTYLPKGSYSVVINLNGKTVKKSLVLD